MNNGEKGRILNSSMRRIKRRGARVTLLATVLALPLGVINLVVEVSILHEKILNPKFIFFTIMGISFILISVLFFVLHRVFVKM